MRVFNLAEELEKERKKNKELEDKIKKLEITKMALIPQYSELKEYNAILKDRIDKAIEYIDKWKFDIEYADIQELLDILKGE